MITIIRDKWGHYISDAILINVFAPQIEEPNT